VQFPYTKLFPNHPARPYLKVFLRNLQHKFHTSNEVVALVDSGADYPIFPMETAKDFLKLDLTQADPWSFSGTTGRLQDAKLAKVLTTVMALDGEKLCEVPTICAFCETFQMAGGVLLGQLGFFSCFKTTFYQPEQWFDIERWPTSPAGIASPASSSQP
jgi:hypothetical protein